MEFKTLQELNNYLNNKMNIVVNDVAYKIYTTLIDCIQTQIYDSKTGNTYERNHYNGGFISSFEQPIIKNEISGCVAQIMYSPNNMISPYEDSINNGYTHGNASKNVDNRNDLWWILNDKSMNQLHSAFGGAYGANSKQGYLEKFTKILNRDFQTWVNSACKAQGLPIVNVGKYTTFIK